MATDKPRFSVTFAEDSFAKIQKYQKDNNISTQSKAVARLVELAISEIESENAVKEPSGVTETAPRNKKAPLYSSEAMRLAADYDGLDAHGRRVVRMVADEEKARCAEQAQPAPARTTTHLYVAARDGSRFETEVEGELIIPDESDEIP